MTKSYLEKKDGYFGATRGEMLSYIPTDAKIVLEIGCGEGRFGALLKEKRGCRVIGIEHMADVAKIAESRLDEVFVMSAEDKIPLPEGYADCIVLNDVLEHLVDPWSAVKKYSQLLRPNGSIVASIPNLRHYKVLKNLVQNGQFEYTDKGVLDRTHLRFFTRKSIPGLFEPAGLIIDRLEGINGTRRYPFKYALINWLTFGGLEDARYLQFACVARKPV